LLLLLLLIEENESCVITNCISKNKQCVIIIPVLLFLYFIFTSKVFACTSIHFIMIGDNK